MDSEAYTQGLETGRRIARNFPGLDDHPMSASYKAANATVMWMGGIECGKAGYDIDQPATGDFLVGFLEGLKAARG